jgi:hypothetical protein
MSSAARFLALFEGSDLAHGQTTVGGGVMLSKGGKVEAQSNVIRVPLGIEHVLGHLSGEQGKGAIPIRSTNDCRFGAIDVDQYDINHSELAARIREMNLPLVVCRSKSGGAHLFLFLSEWAPAEFVRDRLSDIASALGYSGTEIFPKQGTIMTDRGDVGNFINLPYFNAERTLRYAIGDDGQALTLDEFLDEAERRKVTLDELAALDLLPEAEDLRQYPPCLEKIMVALGPVSQNRNITLFNYGVAARKQDPDNWTHKLVEANARYMSPPLEARELNLIIRQHERKEYGFQCTVSPLKDYCRRSACRKRRYGIGGEDQSELASINGLTIVLSDPPLYFVDVDGQRVALSLEDLMSPSLFQRACVYQLRRLPHVPSGARWGKMLSRLLETASTIEVPPELTRSGRFRELVREYCFGKVQATHREELLLGKPLREKGRVIFRVEGLMEFLRQRNFTEYTRAEIQQQIKEMNDDDEYQRTYRIGQPDGRQVCIRVWSIPDDESTVNSLGETGETGEDQETPF